MSEGRIVEGKGEGRSEIPVWINLVSWIPLNYLMIVLPLVGIFYGLVHLLQKMGLNVLSIEFGVG